MRLISIRPIARTATQAVVTAALLVGAGLVLAPSAIAEPADGQEQSAASPESPPVVESAPAPAPAAPDPVPPPPGGSTAWSNSDGTAPSQAWLDAWRQATNTPSNGQNVLLPWESPTGQVSLGQGIAVTGGWSIVDANGNAGGAISCGSLCLSGWFPQGFGADGTPTSWLRVIQQTTAVDGNAFGGPGHYSPENGWTMSGSDGTYAWDWQTNTRGPCIANCPVDESAPEEPAGDPGAEEPATQDQPEGAVNASVARPASSRPVAAAQAELATSVRVASSGRFSVRVSSPALATGDTVRIVVRKGGRVIKAWTARVPDAGGLVITAPRNWLGARVSVTEKGRTVGLAFLAA